MNLNQTTPRMSTPGPRPWFLGYYTLIPFVLFTLLMCVAAAVAYLRRRSRLDDLRHRLIPLYKYDPTEDHGWGDCEDEELTEPLNPDGRLSLSSPYGTNTK